MYLPLNYNKITWVRGHFSPASVKTINSATYAYWERALFQMMVSRLGFDLPDEWQGSNADFFYWVAIRFGYMIVSYLDEFGYWFNPANIKGYNLYYQPVKLVVGNPNITGEFTIGKDCELLKITPDFMGLWDIIAYYAEKLATLDAAINTNIINSKYAFILSARNKAEAEALKTIVDRVNKGEPAVFYDKGLSPNKPNSDAEPFFVTQLQNATNNYIVGDQLRDMQSLINNYCTTIGIQTLPYEKAERFVASEAESKYSEAGARFATIEKTIEASLKKIKKLYPDLKLSYHAVKPDERGIDDNGNSKNNVDRNV